MKNWRQAFSNRYWYTQANQVMLGLDFSSTSIHLFPDL